MQTLFTVSLAAGFGLLCWVIGFYSGIGHMARSIHNALKGRTY